MTPLDCQLIMANLDIIRHIANGGLIEHALYDYKGDFVRWDRPTNKVLISCFGNYRIHKPRIRITHCACCSRQTQQCVECGQPMGEPHEHR
jgi:hypothetical protein